MPLKLKKERKKLKTRDTGTLFRQLLSKESYIGQEGQRKNILTKMKKKKKQFSASLSNHLPFFPSLFLLFLFIAFLALSLRLRYYVGVF